jgi:hypothetical protein
MRTFIVFVLSCVSAFGGDTSIQVTSTVDTNAATVSIYTTDVFTRNGQTNLIRGAESKAGKLQCLVQKFCHAGVFIGLCITTKDSSFFTSVSGIPYSMSFEFWPSKEIRSAVVVTKDGTILDAFTCTNGMFSPAESSELARANSITPDLSHFLPMSHFTNTTPQDFGREGEQFIQKHQE